MARHTCPHCGGSLDDLPPMFRSALARMEAEVQRALAALVAQKVLEDVVIPMVLGDDLFVLPEDGIKKEDSNDGEVAGE